MPTCDLAIVNGRVIDPESGLDDRRNLGIRNGSIETIASEPLKGKTILDAEGAIVAPGFIDLHSHGADPENYALKALDGVTAALELEVGTRDIDAWYAEREGCTLIHYGASVGHIPVRMDVMGDAPAFLPRSRDRAAVDAASEGEIEEIRRRIEQGLIRGAPAVGFGLQYTPGASTAEVVEIFRVAARFRAPCHVHMRRFGDVKSRGSVEALDEIIDAAGRTKAAAHICHLHSTGMRATPELLRRIERARARGLDVTTECYPYTAGMTELGSAIFEEGWKEGLNIGYGDLQWVATGERLTADTFERYRKAGGLVIVHAISESILRETLESPLTAIASDGMLKQGKGHPRSAGCYARVLGRFVREEKILTWTEALRKMALLPARRLEGRVPAMKNKGRLRIGADADLTIFDPDRVIDRSTYEDPARPSEGIRHVVVGGSVLVRDGKLIDSLHPGRAVRAPIGGRKA